MDVFYQQMSMLDIADLLVITPFTFAGQMNTEQLRKQRLFKKKYHAKRFVISTSLSIETYMNGSTLILTTLAEQQLKSKL